jgi:molecular chaperone DnaJ
LYIDLTVNAHPLFQRDGNNLIHRAKLSFVEAALGTVIEIPTLTGAIPLTVPAGTQSGTRFTIYSEGVPVLRGNGRGNLIVELELQTPTNLTSRQEDLLRKFLAPPRKKPPTKPKASRSKAAPAKNAA